MGSCGLDGHRGQSSRTYNHVQDWAVAEGKQTRGSAERYSGKEWLDLAEDWMEEGGGGGYLTAGYLPVAKRFSLIIPGAGSPKVTQLTLRRC